MKITILDSYALNPGDLSWENFSILGEFNEFPRTSPEDLYERAKDSEILITNKTVLTAKDIDKLPKLKYIGLLSTGYDVVDVEAAKKHNIVVTNIPAYSTMSVAQHVFALLLTVTDRIEHYSIANRKGAWSSSKDFCWRDTPLTELAGKAFGIIGLGNIGMAVAKIALAFGMKVMAFTSKKKEYLPDGITKVGLPILLKNSDIISLHCPLNSETDKIINKETIAKMKTGVILINTGRGSLVDETALAEGLSSGKIGAFCADVLSSEPPSEDNPLLTSPNTYITPHIAWATFEARQRLMKIAYENLCSFLNGQPKNVVN